MTVRGSESSGFKRTVEMEDTLDWYAVAMAGEEAMSKHSANGSCSVELVVDGKRERTLYPKGRDSERRAWAMASVITKLKQAGEAKEIQHRFQSDPGINHCGICGEPRSHHLNG